MIEIRPFRGLRYSASHIRDLSNVVAPPYDVITPDLQESLYETHQYNCVRLTFGKIYGSDTPDDNRYTRSAQSLQGWMAKGILAAEAEPSIYITQQEYPVPLWPHGPMTPTKRKQIGFVALFKLKPLTSGDIFPHEKTHGPPKEDRYKLLESTRANFCQVFGLYSDPSGKIEELLKKKIRGKASKVQFQTVEGSEHRMWVESDHAFLDPFLHLVEKSALMIADGHHRYEAALRFAKEHPGRNTPWSHVLMYFTRMEGDGVSVYPTHRLVGGLEKRDAQAFVARLRKEYPTDIVPLDRTNPQKMARRLLSQLEKKGKTPYFGIYVADSTELVFVNAKNTKVKVPAALKQMTVPILHEGFIEPLLGKGKERETRTLGYGVDPVELMHWVDEGQYQIAFFVPPVHTQSVFEAASQSIILPPKTTFFFPKRLSGMVMNKWELPVQEAQAK